LGEKSQNKTILEQDGIQCFDLDMLQSDAQDDLRLSIGAQAKQMPPPALKKSKTNDPQQIVNESPEAELLT